MAQKVQLPDDRIAPFPADATWQEQIESALRETFPMGPERARRKESIRIEGRPLKEERGIANVLRRAGD